LGSAEIALQLALRCRWLHKSQPPFAATGPLPTPGSRRSRLRHPHTGKVLSYSAIDERFKKALRAAKVREVRFEDLRHTFGTRLAATGCRFGPSRSGWDTRTSERRRSTPPTNRGGTRSSGRRSVFRSEAGFLKRSGAETGDTQTDAFGRLGEISIPGDKDDFLVTEFECGSEVDRVIATQRQVFGMLAGADGELLIDPDRSQLRVELLKGREPLPVLLFPQAPQATGSRQGSSSLRVGKDARRRGIGATPELGRQVRAILDDNELDQRRGVEVEDQARCSDTRSETEPVPLTCADRGERDP
jgi:hypothetical protein